jgi:DNA-directed RNA polymerase specialized sigma24 family protein
MPLAERISAHLPELRRFARLLSGTQKAGDAGVARVLEAIVADPSVFPDLPVRVGLYQCFLSFFTTRLIDPAAQSAAIGKTAARSLAALTPHARHAFLLVYVEGFNRHETAQILQVSGAKTEALLKAAEEEIAKQLATDVLIIEDEPLIALDLQNTLKSLGHRVGIARTHKDALRAVAAKQPGLVLADVSLADGSSGLDAVDDMLESFAVPVIFVTAYPDRVTTGQRPEPTFVIAKPFREEAIKAIVSQVLFFDQRSERRPGGQPAPQPQ